MEDIISEDGVELNVYDQIEDKLGINVVALRYIPKEMKFSEIEILENMQQARVFYNYYGEIIRYTIYLNSADSSWVEKIEDQKVDEYFLSVMSQRGSNIEIKIEEYQIPEYDEYRRVASFEYKGIQYQLKGIMEKEEFEKILKNLKFF